MNIAFVIVAYCTKENRCIVDCVNSIRHYHPNTNIIVVDSDSPDKTYFDEISGPTVQICDVKNPSRLTGGIWYAYENFPNIDYFYFLQDSIICLDNVLHLSTEPFKCLRYFPSWDGRKFNGTPGLLNTRCGWADDVPKEQGGVGFQYTDENGLDDRNWLLNQLNAHTNLSIPKEWISIMGPIFFTNRDCLNKIKATGFNKIRPLNKMQECTMERAWGIIFEKIGIDVYNNSIQKYYLHPEYNEEYLFKKVFYLR